MKALASDSSSFRDGAQKRVLGHLTTRYAPGPESITTAWAYGFRAHRFAVPRNDAR
jgi:hypothetical protein